MKRMLRKMLKNRSRCLDLSVMIPVILIMVGAIIYYFAFSPRDINLRSFRNMAILIAGGGGFAGMLCHHRICEWIDKE